MKLNSIVFCVCLFVGTISAQAFPPQFVPSSSQQQAPILLTGGTRRQLTPAQQSHILSDIQQHQHRFAASSPNHLFNPTQNKPFGQKTNVVVEPSIQSQLPTETTVYQLSPQQNFFPAQAAAQTQTISRFRQQPPQHHTQTNFVPNFVAQQQPQSHVSFPQQPLFDRNNLFVQQLPQQAPQPQQQVFQRSVANQQGDHSFKPSQPFPAEQFGQANFAQQPPVQTLQQNQIFQTQSVQGLSPPAVNPYQPFQTIKFPPPQSPHQQQQYLQEEARLKELIEKQKIIQKHEQFVQRQYQKQQQKVRQMHEEFVQRQRRIKEQSIANSNPRINYFPQNQKMRVVSPYDAAAFEKAVESFTTQAPPTTIAEASTPVRVKTSRANFKGDLSEDDLERLLTSHREKIFTHLKQDTDKSPKKSKVKSTKALGREDLLKQLKLALAEQPVGDLGDKNYTTMDLVLPNGEKVQVIRTTDPNLVHGAQPLDDVAQIGSATADDRPLNEQITDTGILPPGSNFEVIKQTEDGNLQSVQSLPNKKKVTFVYLEEQNDGSYKVQGVKANGEKEAKTNGAEVESIIDRIKNGEIQLPPPAQKQNTAAPSPIQTTRVTASSSSSSSSAASSAGPSSTTHTFSPTTVRYESRATPSPIVQFVSTASPYSTLNTVAGDSTFRLTASPSTYYASTTPRSIPSRSSTVTTRGISTSFPRSTSTRAAQNAVSSGDSQATASVSQISSASTVSQTQSSTQAPTTAQTELITILKTNGLHAFAKYLKQSGLDSILNETGPYTVFAPSDKAFKSLLVQLGGPDRADEKFKANPRLLSGLLLHHVIPGHFEINSLQDEMTGVSLAGTQLRVNQYNMHDTEWNDVKVTTINGAMVLPDKQDILIPQGIAHAVDRVMFPLPVGDILQTLQSDRERRFTNFLRALFSSGLSELLQNKDPSSGRTYTVFAPTDAAFGNHTAEEINFMVTDKEASHKLVMRHISSGTLFSSGMRFYQVRDSLQAGNGITLQKVTGGKIKVNESQIVTPNVPTTNGVIHAIDSLL